jgi:hypothetical protein
LIDAADLTIEPLSFGRGLPLFSQMAAGEPLVAMRALGLIETAVVTLNARGTRLHRFNRQSLSKDTAS